MTADPIPVLDGQMVLAQEWTRDEACAYVTTAYAASVAAVVETGRRLIEVNQDLKRTGQWMACFEGEGALPFSQPTAHRLMSVAAHDALASYSNWNSLPLHTRTLAELKLERPA